MLGMVVHGVTVSRCGVVEVGIEVEVVAGLSPVVVESLRTIEIVFFLASLLQGWIGLQFLLDARLQLQRGHLQQFHQLNLLGTQLLLQLLLEALLEHVLNITPEQARFAFRIPRSAESGGTG